MKKVILLCTIVCLLLSCVGCGTAAPAATVAPTAAPTEPKQEPTAAPTEPPHACESICEYCSRCTNEVCEEPVCAEKCLGFHEDFIAEEATVIDTGVLEAHIGKEVYVPGDVPTMVETIAQTMEGVSGLKFDGGKTDSSITTAPKTKLNVNQKNQKEGTEDAKGRTAENGGGYISMSGKQCTIGANPLDLFLGHSNYIVYGMSNALRFCQSQRSYGSLLNDGFETYTTYLTVSALEETDPELAYYLGWTDDTYVGFGIDQYRELVAQPFEYWFDNHFSYVVGFNFMAYLHETYGDYSKWIPAFENQYSHVNSKQGATGKQCVEVLKSVYGEDVLDNFYPWLQENMDRFDREQHSTEMRDLSGAKEINWYPKFSDDTTAILSRVQYKDLLIHIDPMRNYLTEYKGFDGNDLMLITSEPVEVILHYADGTTRTVITNSEAPETTTEVYGSYKGIRARWTTEVTGGLPLEGVSTIELVGEGQLDWLEVVGDFRQLYQ